MSNWSTHVDEDERAEDREAQAFAIPLHVPLSEHRPVENVELPEEPAGDPRLPLEAIKAELAELGISTDVVPGVPSKKPRKSHPYAPLKTKHANVFSVPFRHPISGNASGKRVVGMETARAFSNRMYALWVANGRPQQAKKNGAPPKTPAGGRGSGHPYRAKQLDNGMWVARYRHPVTGNPTTAPRVATEAQALRIAKAGHQKWLDAGSPKGGKPSKTTAVQHVPRERADDRRRPSTLASEFPTFGEDLKVVMLSALNGEPRVAIQDGDGRTWLLAVVGRVDAGTSD